MRATILVDNHAPDGLLAEWGLSILIEQEGRRILLDTGSSGRFLQNAAALGLDLSQVEAAVLSHAHYDHADGMAAFFAQNAAAPFYLCGGAAENCYRKNRITYHYIGIHRGYLKQFAGRIRYGKEKREITPGIWLLPHSTPGLDRAGKRARMYVRRGLLWRPDDFSHEQSLVVETADGLAVFNSCSHAGADCIIREVRAAWPETPIAALIGGLHLFRSSDEAVRAFAGRVRKTGIKTIYTGHCTGDRALAILKEELRDGCVRPFETGMVIAVGESRA